ncbi:9598_t:CDS:1, partial [Scutellospora calospora]
GVLSKKFVSKKNPTNIKKQEFKFDESDPNLLQNIENQLKIWNEQFKKVDVDTSFFLNNNGEAISRDGIKDWLKNLENKPSNWEVISSEDWMPICNIISKGENLIQDIKKKITIKFPKPFSNKNYHIVGNVVKENVDYWENVPEITVIFDRVNENT